MTEFKFRPLVDFEWWVGEKLIGHYQPGMTYNCTSHPSHDALRDKCQEWQKAGKIQILSLAPQQYFETKRFA